MTANRVAALGGFLAALGALIAAFAGVFPVGWQNDVLAVVALLSKSSIVLHYLTGAQKWEAGQRKPVAKS